jgi:hypothetical protein
MYDETYTKYKLLVKYFFFFNLWPNFIRECAIIYIKKYSRTQKKKENNLFFCIKIIKLILI